MKQIFDWTNYIKKIPELPTLSMLWEKELVNELKIIIPRKKI